MKKAKYYLKKIIRIKIKEDKKNYEDLFHIKYFNFPKDKKLILFDFIKVEFEFTKLCKMFNMATDD